ncbi:LacI family DNA-binding transcriptional regulator [Niallia taxi]|uniref:LacI family transcriptional regulator n=1 Tax=Niallia taxi TaxID=2499688 RepID=A0A437KF09_9BACI|nr:LacI family DNA-binding transcriptional regulator [Niallia taxi]RVT65612.1 LacI family transcriptional regulator [Niallia taxi]
MGVTIKDIAKLANVSHTTVSRALNGSPLIKPDTKKKILELAEQLHYVPNYSAKSLVLKKSYTIGLFFTSISNGTSSTFLANVIKGVNGEIDENYNLFVRGIDDYKDFAAINGQRFDGIVLMSQSDEDDAFIEHVKQQNIPIVVLNREIDDPSITNILSNDESGAMEATNYLVSQGHERIAIIEGKESFKTALKRKNGYMQALMQNSLAINKRYIVKGSYDMESGYHAMEQLLALNNPPSAVFCSNDDMAIGAINAIFANGLHVPKDISIVGFDNSAFSQYVMPKLTTVQRPIEQISQKGAKKLLELINDSNETGESVFVKTELIIRDSVIPQP